MKTYGMSTRATIARDGDDTYILTVETLQDAPEELFVAADLTRKDVETIAGWANAPQAAPGGLLPTVHAGRIDLTLYPNNRVAVSAGDLEAAISWLLTETASRELIEEAGRWIA